MNTLKKPIHYLTIMLFAGIASAYYFIDRPLVEYLHAHHARSIPGLAWLANVPVSMMTAIFAVFYFWMGYVICTKRQTETLRRCLYIANAVVITVFLKIFLKHLFGRAWPATFFCANPSYLSDGVYGFFGPHAGRLYISFPSGHAAFIASAMVGVALFFPRWRWPSAVVAWLVMCAQVTMYYHYLSDVLAGAWLGGMIAALAYRYFLVCDKNHGDSNNLIRRH